jgi:8-amino-7-oxononanoate synthase
MREELEKLQARSQMRTLVESIPSEDGWVIREGKRLLNLASNHYLGLEQHVNFARTEDSFDLTGAGESDFRAGSTASRLIVGNAPVFNRFEKRFAAFKGTESCLLFSSGYMANVGVISSLAGRNDVVFSDRLNHASIIDGITLSRAEHVRYRHRDLDHLEKLLQKAKPGQKKLIVTDSIFSMDGTIAPLRELVELKERYGAILMVDEAHSGGIYGAQGEGLAHELGLTRGIDVHMGTFSKAYGCYGAYIAGDEILKRYLINKARSFIYTTALPPMVVASIERNWLKVKQDNWRREELHRKSAWFRRELTRLGFYIGESECHIVPLIVGDNELTVRLGERLTQEGIAAVAIRPPTVPEGTARIRFTLMATHRDEDLAWAVDCLERAGKEYGII